MKTSAYPTCACGKKGGKRNISKQATKQRLKWQKQLKDDISKVITVHLVWGREIKKKRKEKLTAHADVSWKWRQQQSLKKEEKETNKELYGRQSGWGKLYTLVCTLYRMQPRSVFIWTWDGRTWYHPRYAHSITLSVHGVRLHALFKATARFKFLHWTDQKNGKSKPSNQGPVKQTGVANQSVVCLCLEVQGEGQKRKEEARRGEQSGTVSDGGCNPRLVSRLNKAFV